MWQPPQLPARARFSSVWPVCAVTLGVGAAPTWSSSWVTATEAPSGAPGTSSSPCETLWCSLNMSALPSAMVLSRIVASSTVGAAPRS